MMAKKKKHVPFSRNYRGAKYDRVIGIPKTRRDAEKMAKDARSRGHKVHIKKYDGKNHLFIKYKKKE